MKKFVLFLLSTMTNRIFQIVGLILLIPLITMQFTDEVNWSLFDFILMGAMLTITGFSVGTIYKKVKNGNVSPILILYVILIFLLVWAELAVGLFGTPFAGG